MRIAVLGTGGIGGYFGGRLAAAGHEVTFLARGAHLEAIREHGLVVTSVAGDFTVESARVTDDAASIGEVDTVLLAVKTWQLPPLLESLPALVGPDTAVVTTQNGVEAPDQVARVVGREAVLPGIAKIFAFIDAPGHVTHAGGPASLVFDEWSTLPGSPSARVTRLREAVTASGAVSPVPVDIWAELWSKMLFVVPFGGLGAALDATIGELRSRPEQPRPARGRDARGRGGGSGAGHRPAADRRSPARWPSSTTSQPVRPRHCSATCSRASRPSSTPGPAPWCGSRATPGSTSPAASPPARGAHLATATPRGRAASPPRTDPG